jgi:Cu-Zn family superoxide dismutase
MPIRQCSWQRVLLDEVKMKYMILAGAALAVAGCEMAPSASAVLESRSGSTVSGSLTLVQIAADKVRITGEISGHSPGAKGFHIHDKGDCSAPDAMSAAGHFNPAGKKHGSPAGGERHAGDLGNLTFDSTGKVTVDVVADGVSLAAGQANNIIGRAIVLHAQTDDLKTDPTGNAGGRVACGVIQM